MSLQSRKVRIVDAIFDITGDSGYLTSMGDTFEPATLDVLHSLVTNESHVIDVGANIGFTSIAFSTFCPNGKIAAVEPVPRTFELLEKNLSAAGVTNVSRLNFALGAQAGELKMQGNPDFLAGSFVADKFSINDGIHFVDTVPVYRLDEAFESMGLARIDAMKVDVEGFELDVFEGARATLETFRPLVFMEMNHWCLSMFRRMTIPDFRERLLSIFPYIYAIHGLEACDMRVENVAYYVAHEHLTQNKFTNLIAGFDKDRVATAIERYKERRAAHLPAWAGLLPHEIDALIARAKAAEERARIYEYRSEVLEKVVNDKERLIWALEEKLARK
ncbi:FkbM family methyltransferase [Paraburkholderia sp. BR13439]|uniref:FkbM family methyltransferase n=1 Tax=Paraburkholderia sp. BR13439 TaxID=3236996 RepID=UPI0034CF1A8E